MPTLEGVGMAPAFPQRIAGEHFSHAFGKRGYVRIVRCHLNIMAVRCVLEMLLGYSLFVTCVYLVVKEFRVR